MMGAYGDRRISTTASEITDDLPGRSGAFASRCRITAMPLLVNSYHMHEPAPMAPSPGSGAAFMP